MTIGTFILIAFCVGFVGTLALGLCKTSGQFSREEEEREARRKWGK